MPHMLRIAVESVHDDDGRGVSASRSASQRIVPTASLPPFLPPPATYPVSGRSRQMLRRFLLSGARAARIVRSFGHRPFGDCMYEMEEERTDGARGSRRCEHKCLCFVSLDNVRYRHSLEFRVVSCSSSSPDAF